MKSLGNRSIRFVLVPLMVVSLSSACGTWAVQEIAPRHGGIGLYGSQASEHRQIGEEARAPGIVCGPQMQLEGTAYPDARWDPSGAQIAASVGIGALWFIFGVVKPTVDDLDDIGDGIAAAAAPTLTGGQP
ncbi:MAG: hypothetical protein JSW71_10540 [Gemmatimonadota bacterium]|nr:MAG: hypothetical protein JSW71_10540 [Gemmatimonadota bacterium]